MLPRRQPRLDRGPRLPGGALRGGAKVHHILASICEDLLGQACRKPKKMQPSKSGPSRASLGTCHLQASFGEGMWQKDVQ
jgi:hypothetical protein